MKPKSTLTVGEGGAINRAALLFVILLSTLAAGATAQDFARWRYYRAINFDTSESGANVKGEVRNYPVAVALNASNFDFSQTRPDGADIRFSTLENGSENGAMATAQHRALGSDKTDRAPLGESPDGARRHIVPVHLHALGQ